MRGREITADSGECKLAMETARISWGGSQLPTQQQQSCQVSIHVSRQGLALLLIQPRIPGDQGSS